MRLRPVLITVGVTVNRGLPAGARRAAVGADVLRAQIGGLCAATFITLLLVPVLYAIFVLDLKLVKWETAGSHAGQDSFDGLQPPSVVEQSGAAADC